MYVTINISNKTDVSCSDFLKIKKRFAENTAIVNREREVITAKGDRNPFF